MLAGSRSSVSRGRRNSMGIRIPYRGYYRTGSASHGSTRRSVCRPGLVQRAYMACPGRWHAVRGQPADPRESSQSPKHKGSPKACGRSWRSEEDGREAQEGDPTSKQGRELVQGRGALIADRGGLPVNTGRTSRTAHGTSQGKAPQDDGQDGGVCKAAAGQDEPQHSRKGISRSTPHVL